MQTRRFRFLRVFVVLAVLLSAMGSLSLSASAAPLNMASPDRDTYQAAASMTGQVLSTLGDPIVGATVVIEETGQSTTSVDGGYYAIGGVPNGDYTVTASAVGFEPQSVSASIVDGTNGVANFALVPVGASVTGRSPMPIRAPGLSGRRSVSMARISARPRSMAAITRSVGCRTANTP